MGATNRVTFINIEDHPEKRADALATGYMQLPIVVTETDSWSGFRPDKIDTI